MPTDRPEDALAFAMGRGDTAGWRPFAAETLAALEAAGWSLNQKAEVERLRRIEAEAVYVAQRHGSLATGLRSALRPVPAND